MGQSAEGAQAYWWRGRWSSRARGEWGFGGKGEVADPGCSGWKPKLCLVADLGDMAFTLSPSYKRHNKAWIVLSNSVFLPSYFRRALEYGEAEGVRIEEVDEVFGDDSSSSRNITEQLTDIAFLERKELLVSDRVATGQAAAVQFTP